MRKFSLIVIFTISVSAIFAQQNWSLEQCIQHALQNNIQIKSQNLNTQINENQLRQSKLSILPGLNAGASESFTFGRSVDNYTNEFSSENFSSTNFQVSSSVTLFSGLQQLNTVKKAEIDQRAGLVLLDQTRNNIMLAVASAYLNVLYALDLLEIAEQQKAITAMQVERTIKLVNSGSLPLQNRYELEAQLANEELNIINYQNQLDLTLLSLAQLIELENTNSFSIIRPDSEKIAIESSSLTIDQIYREALSKMPQIEYANLNYLSAEKNLEIAKGVLYPRLSLSGSFGTGYSTARKEIDNITLGTPYLSGFATDNLGNILDVYNYNFNYTYQTRPFSDQINDNASASLVFNLSIPIFNGLQARSNMLNSRIYLDQAMLQVDQAKKDLFKEIQQAYSDAQSAVKKYSATEKTLGAVELSFDYTQKRYEQGLLNTTEYNIAKNSLTQTQTELIRARYDMIFKHKILDFYRGVPIKL